MNEHPLNLLSFGLHKLLLIRNTSMVFVVFLRLLNTCIVFALFAFTAHAQFIDNKNGTVSDSQNKLMWKVCPEGQIWSAGICSGVLSRFSWDVAVNKKCEESSLGCAGKNDWRIPTISELRTLVYREGISVKINTNFFPGTKDLLFWSATTSSTFGRAVYMDFEFGLQGDFNVASINPVRLVRSTLNDDSGGGTTGGGTTGGGTTGGGTTGGGTTGGGTTGGGTTGGGTTVDCSIRGIPFASGWNLLANSYSASLNVNSNSFVADSINTVWKWDREKAQWNFYSPKLTEANLNSYLASRGYGRLNVISSGEGFWINASKSGSVIQNVCDVFKPNLDGSKPEYLLPGWNLLGYSESVTPAQLNQNLNLLPPDTSSPSYAFNTLWLWNNLESKWYFYAPSLSNFDLNKYILDKGFLDFSSNNKKIEPGTGFWINKSANTTIVENRPTMRLSINDKRDNIVLNGLADNKVQVVLRDAAGAPVPNVIVKFSSSITEVELFPSNGNAATDSNGVASINIKPSSTTGAGSLLASAQVNSMDISDRLVYTVQPRPSIKIDPPLFGVSQLSSFGTTSVTASVFNVDGANATLVTTQEKVLFTSNCVKENKATLIPSAITINGKATATYVDKGCASSDVITVQLENSPSIVNSATLSVLPPAAASIQFVKTDPQLIRLAGMGGNQTATVTFKVVDAANKPLQDKSVNFSLSTTVGGIAFGDGSITTSGKTDVDGIVNVIVKSGNRSTPVRVVATTLSGNNNTNILSTQSEQLTIATGIPDQDSFSLSADVFNIEGLQYEGEQVKITVRMADQYQNPVPDGTVINFQSEGGKIDSFCTTIGSACTVTLTSQDPRPPNSRVTILAYAIGEETFTDLNGNGLADNVSEMVDLAENSTDKGEAFLDVNENGVRDSNEPFVDFNSNSTYDGPDGKFNGVSCDTNSAVCSVQRTLNVYSNIEIVFSGSFALIDVLPSIINLPGEGCGGVQNLLVRATDRLGNSLPAGTTIELATTNGKVSESASKFVVASTNSITPVLYGSKVESDGVVTYTPATEKVPASEQCEDKTRGGTLIVTVKTPKGVVTQRSIEVRN